jgi:hypothetical protein
MKALFTVSLLAFFVTACGRESHVDDSHLIDIGNGGSGIPSEGCTDAALISLNNTTALCDRDLSAADDKELCVSSTEAYRKNFPDVICNLEGEVIITEKFIEEELSPATDPEEKTPLQELIETGIFDE